MSYNLRKKIDIQNMLLKYSKHITSKLPHPSQLQHGRQSNQRLSGQPVQTAVRRRHAAITEAPDRSAAASKEEYQSALPFSSIPGPPGIPWLGRWLEYKLDQMKIFRRDLILQELYSKYGYIVKETVAGRKIVHLFHPDYIKQVYEAEGKYPMVPPLLECVGDYRRKNGLAPGLGNSNGEEWYKLRKVVQHIMLRPQKSLDYLPLQNKVADDFVNKFDSLIGANGEIPDFNRWVARWGLESAANTCLDLRLGYLEGHGTGAANKIIDTNSAVFTISVQLFFALPFYRLFPTPQLRQLFECEDYINQMASTLVQRASRLYREAVEENRLTEDRFMFLSYLLGSKHISEGEILPVVLSVLTDTLSTTTQALLFNLYTLACNPQAQEKAFEEAKQILNAAGELQAEGFNNCVYLKACLKETFRQFPIGLDILRLCPGNMVIGSYQVPEGTYLCLNNYCYSLDPNVISNPEMYSPERWLREDEGNEKVHPYMLTPFSLGRRMCAGRRFAEQELVILLSKILTRYRLEWHHGKLYQFYRLLSIPDNEVRVKFIPR